MFQVGDLVRVVRPNNDELVVGTVVRQVVNNNKKKKSKSDEIVVETLVSKNSVVYPAAQLEHYTAAEQEEEKDTIATVASSSTKARRSTRVTTNPLRSIVTPSPVSNSDKQQQNGDNNDQDDDAKKPAAKRKRRSTVATRNNSNNNTASSAPASARSSQKRKALQDGNDNNSNDDDNDKDDEPPQTGDCVYALWPDNQKWYYGRIVAVVSTNDLYDIEFDDGDTRTAVPRAEFQVVQASDKPCKKKRRTTQPAETTTSSPFFQEAALSITNKKNKKTATKQPASTTNNNNDKESSSSTAAAAAASSSNKPPAWVVEATWPDQKQGADSCWSDVGEALFADDDTTNKQPAATKTKNNKAVASIQVIRRRRRPNNNNANINDDASDHNNDNSDISNDSDDDDQDDDRPFTCDYAPTGRATCRRCDERIAKGTVRVSHRPLFRGQPGFLVHRHLACAVFDETITEIQQVGGWRRLKQADQLLLEKRLHASAVELQAEQEELQPDELVQESFAGPLRELPAGLTATLLPFQREGTSWMYCQEVNSSNNNNNNNNNSSSNNNDTASASSATGAASATASNSNNSNNNTIRGGMLCDEMGLGKTLQSITMILDHRPLLQHSKPGAKHPPGCTDMDARNEEEKLWKTSLTEWKHEMDMNNVVPKLRPKKLSGARAGTLVVCPVIALHQWKTEIEKFTEAGTLSVGIYHGPKRASEMPAAMMTKYDVVLTTYQVLEQDFRKMVSPNKVECPNCGAKFKIDKLRVHLKYFCGETAQRTEAQARQRRTAPGRPFGRGGGGGGDAGKGGGKKKKGGKALSKKPPTTTVAKKTASSAKKKKPAAPAKRKTVRVRHTADYDSDSELSIVSEDETPSSRGRPSRSAAVAASKRVKSSMKDWKQGVEDAGDESSFASSSAPSSDEEDDEHSSDSDDGSLSDQQPVAKKPRAKKSGRMSDLERATEKQRKAIEAANKSKSAAKGKTQAKGKKKAVAKKKGTPKGKGKKGKKKFDDDPNSSSSDDESGDDDPLAGIDMKELMDEAMAGARFSPLHSFCWWRIILDESHFIKSRSSQTAAAAFSLTGIHRWCLSGTPLQNRVSELYSLIRFLRIDPMAYYYCKQKDCDCRSLHYRMVNGTCQGCGHRSFTHYAHFNRYVLNPIQNDGYVGDGRRAMFKLKNEVLDKCLLRRTKETKAADLELPPRLVTLRSIRLHPIEADFYEALYTQTKSSFDDYIAEGTLLNNYAHIFDLLTKMRQAVNHPYLIVYSKTNVERNRGQAQPLVANGSVDCEMCHEPPTDRVLSTCCGAGFCRSCVVEYITGAGGGEDTPCPGCRAPFTIDLNQKSSAVAVDDGTLVPKAAASSASGAAAASPSLKELSHVPTGSILRRINLAEFATSTKIEALVQELVEMRKKRPGSKALVFSQFVNMLDLVRWRLHSDPFLADLGLGATILHGGMDVKSRNQVLKSFREDNSNRVLLMSLKSAGVALNLTVASECYILDLWWNPAAEMQAIDRCHRIGQHRPIRAVRFVAEGTVEERVLQLQEKKRLVFDGTIGRDAGSLKMLTQEDMKALFT